jgi:hypothetical protein
MMQILSAPRLSRRGKSGDRISRGFALIATLQGGLPLSAASHQTPAGGDGFQERYRHDPLPLTVEVIAS